MKSLIYISACFLMLAVAYPAHAQLFYNNTLFPGINAAYASTDEIADDTPFTGTQHVASFTFNYMNLTSSPTSATVRFYGVDPTSGGVGGLVATVQVDNLAPATAQLQTVTLDASQQFDWTAQPGIYGQQSVTGGFVSFQFSTPQSGWYEAAGVSANGFYDVTTGQFITFQESEASFYLQISGSATPVTLTSFLVNPASVKGGVKAKARVTLSGPAPAGGVVVSLSSSNPRIASLPATVTVPAGSTSATVTVTTKPVRTKTTLALSATLDGATQTATMVVTP
jgi:hypothetical protein